MVLESLVDEFANKSVEQNEIQKKQQVNKKLFETVREKLIGEMVNQNVTKQKGFQTGVEVLLCKKKEAIKTSAPEFAANVFVRLMKDKGHEVPEAYIDDFLQLYNEVRKNSTSDKFKYYIKVNTAATRKRKAAVLTV